MDIIRDVSMIISFRTRHFFLVLGIPVATFLLVTSVSAADVSGFSSGTVHGRSIETKRSASQQEGMIGTWLEDLGDLKVKVVFGEDESFSRTMTEGSATVTVEGRYRMEGNKLVVEPDGFEPLSFEIIENSGNSLIIHGEDGSRSQMSRLARGEGTQGEAPTGEGLRQESPEGGNLPPLEVNPHEGRTQRLSTDGQQAERIARRGEKDIPDTEHQGLSLWRSKETWSRKRSGQALGLPLT